MKLSRILILAVAMIFAAAQSRALGQGADVSHLVPAQIGFATEFAQRLSDSGWKVQKVALSKFNGGFFGPTKAAWIKTDHGILEVVYFDKPAELEAVTLIEETPLDADYHKYEIVLAAKTERMEGRLPVFLTKFQDKLLVVYDRKLYEALTDLLKPRYNPSDPIAANEGMP